MPGLHSPLKLAERRARAIERGFLKVKRLVSCERYTATGTEQTKIAEATPSRVLDDIVDPLVQNDPWAKAVYKDAGSVCIDANTTLWDRYSKSPPPPPTSIALNADAACFSPFCVEDDALSAHDRLLDNANALLNVQNNTIAVLAGELNRFQESSDCVHQQAQCSVISEAQVHAISRELSDMRKDLNNLAASLSKAITASLDTQLPPRLAGLATMQDLEQHSGEVRQLLAALPEAMLKDCQSMVLEICAGMIMKRVPEAIHAVAEKFNSAFSQLQVDMQRLEDRMLGNVPDTLCGASERLTDFKSTVNGQTSLDIICGVSHRQTGEDFEECYMNTSHGQQHHRYADYESPFRKQVCHADRLSSVEFLEMSRLAKIHVPIISEELPRPLMICDGLLDIDSDSASVDSELDSEHPMERVPDFSSMGPPEYKSERESSQDELLIASHALQS